MKNKDIPIMFGVGDIPNKVAIGMKNNNMGGGDRRMRMQEIFEKIIEKLEELKNHYNECCLVDYNEGAAVGLTEAMNIVRQAAAEDNNGWIPCSERLPEEPKPNPLFENKPLEFYMVTEKGTTYPFRAFWNGKAFTDGWSKLDVIAWQPLLRPYEPKED